MVESFQTIISLAIVVRARGFGFSVESCFQLQRESEGEGALHRAALRQGLSGPRLYVCFLSLRNSQNPQQAADVAEEGQRAGNITLRWPSLANSRVAARRFAQTSAVAAENAEAALIRSRVAQPLVL